MNLRVFLAIGIVLLFSGGPSARSEEVPQNIQKELTDLVELLLTQPPYSPPSKLLTMARKLGIERHIIHELQLQRSNPTVTYHSVNYKDGETTRTINVIKDNGDHRIYVLFTIKKPHGGAVYRTNLSGSLISGLHWDFPFNGTYIPVSQEDLNDEISIWASSKQELTKTVGEAIEEARRKQRNTTP